MHSGDPRGRVLGPKSLIVPRLYRLLWVLEFEGEVASDLSAFHRVDNMWYMGSRRWALLVPRLYAYGGAVQLRLKAYKYDETATAPTHQPSARPTGRGGGVQLGFDGKPMLPGPPSPMQGGEVVEATQTALALSPIGDMFSFGNASAPS